MIFWLIFLLIYIYFYDQGKVDVMIHSFPDFWSVFRSIFLLIFRSIFRSIFWSIFLLIFRSIFWSIFRLIRWFSWFIFWIDYFPALSGFKTNGEAWQYPYVEVTESYTDADFMTDMKAVWLQLLPLYKELWVFYFSNTAHIVRILMLYCVINSRIEGKFFCNFSWVQWRVSRLCHSFSYHCTSFFRLH